MKRRRLFYAIGIVVVVLAGSYALVTAKLAARSDGNGVPISRYDGVFGYAGGAVAQIAVVDGWPIVHVVPAGKNGEICGIGHATAGGLGLSRWPSGGPLAQQFYEGHASLTPGDVLKLSMPGFETFSGPRRPLYRPRLESMWIVDGKASIMVPCSPTFKQRVQMLWLSLTSA